MNKPRWCVALLPLLAWSCGDSGGSARPIEQVRTFAAPGKKLTPMNSFDRLGMSRPEPPSQAQPQLAWDTPAGWEELPPAMMRDANFRIGGADGAQCYLTLLRQVSSLKANVDRWRGQLGQPPLGASAFAALPKAGLLGGEGVLVDVSGTFGGKPDQRLIGIVAVVQGRMLATLKLIGPAAVVGPQKEAFTALASSFRLENAPAAGHGAGAGAAMPAAASAGSGDGDSQVAWDVPDGWQVGRAGGMRAATFHPGGSPDLECVLYHFARPAGGDLATNLGRWAKQMGAPAPQPDSLQKIEVLGGQWPLLDLKGKFAGGMGKPPIDDAAMLAVYSEIPGHVYCIKLAGPAAVVAQQREHFLEFCKSLRTKT